MDDTEGEEQEEEEEKEADSIFQRHFDTPLHRMHHHHHHHHRVLYLVNIIEYISSLSASTPDQFRRSIY